MGLIRENPVLDPLAGLHLNNQLFILLNLGSIQSTPTILGTRKQKIGILLEFLKEKDFFLVIIYF